MKIGKIIGWSLLATGLGLAGWQTWVHFSKPTTPPLPPPVDPGTGTTTVVNTTRPRGFAGTTTTAAAAPKAFDSGWTLNQPVFIKGDMCLIFTYPSTSSQSYMIGSVKKADFLDHAFATYQGDANANFAKVLIQGYMPTGKTTMVKGAKTVYVPVSSIQKSAF